jgi:hypothetical protein
LCGKCKIRSEILEQHAFAKDIVHQLKPPSENWV